MLNEGDDDASSTWTPRVIAITAIISLCLIGVVVWAIASKRNDVATAPTEPVAAVKEQVVERTTAPAGNRGPATPAPFATPVFLPAPQVQQGYDNPRSTPGIDLNRATTAVRPEGRVTINLGDAITDPVFVRVPVRLSSGILHYIGPQRAVSGRVAIVNSSEHNVVEFRLDAEINGKSYALTPYEGTIEKPRPLKSLTIGPGEKVSIPVMIPKFSGRKSGIVQAKISMDAWLDSGDNDELTDTILTP